MTEKLGGRHSIRPDANRPASHHGEHTQRTQATPWAEQYQGPVRPVETYLHPNSLNDENGLRGLTPGGRAVADRLNIAHEQYFRKHGHGI